MRKFFFASISLISIWLSERGWAIECQIGDDGLRCHSYIECRKEEERIYCTYYLDRSDTVKQQKVRFYWISPKSPQDDRVRHFLVPKGCGAIYDYRFLPGRISGLWRVEAKNLETNATASTTFTIDRFESTLLEN